MNSPKIHIWENPESRIQFMETVMKDSEWQAVIHAPPMHTSPETLLVPLQKTLQSHGYITEMEEDENRRPVLSIRHVGKETDLLVNLKHLGLVEGARRSIENVPHSLGKMLNATWSGLQYACKDSARLLSSIYLIGDIAYTMTGLAEGKADAAAVKKEGNVILRLGSEMAHKLTNFKDISSGLMSFSGIAALAQSIIFLEFARDGSEINMEKLSKDMEKSIAKGRDPLEALHGDKEKESDTGMLSGLHSFFQRHPIELGAASQVMGQVALFAAAGLNLKRGNVPAGKDPASFRKGETLNMARSVTSIAGWFALMHPSSDVGKKSPWSDPHRIVQQFNEHPEHFASGLNFGASALGLWSSGHRDNLPQKIAESTWLVGDVVMAFVDKSHYGKDGEKAEEMAGKAASEFLQQSPIAFSPSAGEKMYKDLGRYIARRTVETNAPAAPKGTDEHLFEKEREASIDQLSEQLTRSIMKAMAGKQSRYARIVHQAALLVDFYPEEDRAKVSVALAKAVTDIPGIYATPEETVEAITSAHTRIARTSGKEAPTASPGMATIAPAVSELIYALPGLNLALAANGIYDALTPFSRTSPRDELLLNHTLTAQAGQALGMTSRETEAAMRQQKEAAPAIS